MRTYFGQIGRINAHALPTIIAWFEPHGIPYDELIVGKPWCGFDGFYVDGKAVRADEFAQLSYDEIKALLVDAAARLKPLKGWGG
jgi:capsule biosynthesis phosphatase